MKILSDLDWLFPTVASRIVGGVLACSVVIMCFDPGDKLAEYVGARQADADRKTTAARTRALARFDGYEVVSGLAPKAKPADKSARVTITEKTGIDGSIERLLKANTISIPTNFVRALDLPKSAEAAPRPVNAPIDTLRAMKSSS